MKRTIPFLIFAALAVACTDDQPLTVEPPTLAEVASSGTISGRVYGPSGVSICDYLATAQFSRIRVVDAAGALVAHQDLCPDNGFSLTVASGSYYLLMSVVPGETDPKDLPLRTLDLNPVVVDGADVVRDVHVEVATRVAGGATLDGEVLSGVSLTLGIEPGYDGWMRTYATSGADGAWDDYFFWGSPFRLQTGLHYSVGCQPAWGHYRPPPGFSVTAMQEPFLFPDEADAIDCTYESQPYVESLPYGIGVTANNYQLRIWPYPRYGEAHLYRWPYLGPAFFSDGVAHDAINFGGGLAYTTDAEHSFLLYDPRGGTAGNLISTGRWPYQGLRPEAFEPGPFADQQTLTVLRERPEDSRWDAEALDLIVVRETYAYSAAPDDDYIIFKFTVFNPGSEPVEGLNVGQALDQDLTWWANDAIRYNTVEYDAAEEVVVVTGSRTAVVAGHALLGVSPANYRSWANPSNPLPGQETRIDPYDLATWHDYLSSGIVSPEPFGSTDIRHLLSIGPLAVASNSSIAFASVLAGGHDRDDLLANVAAARARYGSLPAAARSPYPVLAVGVEVSKIKPFKHHFESTFIFADPETAMLFDKSQTECAGAGVGSWKRIGSTIVAEHWKSELDPWIDNGDRVVCVGKLSDGTLFSGSDAARIE